MIIASVIIPLMLALFTSERGYKVEGAAQVLCDTRQVPNIYDDDYVTLFTRHLLHRDRGGGEGRGRGRRGLMRGRWGSGRDVAASFINTNDGC